VPLSLLALASILNSVAAQFTPKAGTHNVRVHGALGTPPLLAALGRVASEPAIYAGFPLYGPAP